MILVDANLLLYAYHPRSEQHEASRAWLEGVLSGSELVRFAWLALWAFLRISTNPRVFERPLVMDAVLAAIGLEHGAILHTRYSRARISGRSKGDCRRPKHSAGAPPDWLTLAPGWHR
jgi:hypothetical protein